MTIWISGLPYSGRKTMKNILYNEGHWAEVLDSDTDLENLDFENDIFIIVRAPTLHCWKRWKIHQAKKALEDYIKKTDYDFETDFLELVSELEPFEIKNNESLDMFKVRIKKFIEKELP